MGRKHLGALPEEIVDQYDTEAEQLGLSRVEYVRKCTEAGRTLLQSSGQADIELLREFTEDVSTTTFDSELATTNSDIVEVILNNLPTEEQHALTREEVRDTVFGTKDEQNKEIMSALKQLRRQGEIESLVGDGYIKIND